MKLRGAGFEHFTIFEKSRGLGGTWWDNQYPGAEVDVASHLYSFPFKPYDWTRTHARQAELQQYLEDVIDGSGCGRTYRFATPSSASSGTTTRHVYDVTTRRRRDGECDVLDQRGRASSTCPRYPDWPGLDAFAGPAFHTAALGAPSTTSPARPSRWSVPVRPRRRSSPRSPTTPDESSCSSASRAG